MDIKTKSIYYGFDDNNDVVAKNVKLTGDGSSFDVYMNNNFYGHFDIPLFGNHMILNALSCIIVCDKEGMPYEEIHEKLQTFKNAKRRFVVKELGDVVEVDDYAHHPTEIRVTLESAKQKYPDKEVVAVFLPNTYSRTRDLLDDFIDVLGKADKAYVMDIECNREKQEDYPGVTSDSIIEKVNNAEKISTQTADKLLKHQNAVICFMSCANIHPMEEAFEKVLEGGK